MSHLLLELQVTSELVIHRVFYEDRGSYRCRATNTDVEGVQRTAVSNFSELTVMRKDFPSVHLIS